MQHNFESYIFHSDWRHCLNEGGIKPGYLKIAFVPPADFRKLQKKRKFLQKANFNYYKFIGYWFFK
jgi:hypothetical protein